MPTIWNVTGRMEGNVMVLHAAVRGLSVEQPADGLRLFSVIQGHVRDGYNVILINLRDAHYLDSMGLGEIVNAFKLAQGSSGALGVCELIPKIRGLFTLTKLDVHIPIFETELEGLQALRQRDSAHPS